MTEKALTAARDQWRKVADSLHPTVPKLAALMDAAEPDVLAYMTSPSAHRTKLHSTNPIERLSHEIKRRTEVVGILPNEDAIRRLVAPCCWNKPTNGPCNVPATCRATSWPTPWTSPRRAARHGTLNPAAQTRPEPAEPEATPRSGTQSKALVSTCLGNVKHSQREEVIFGMNGGVYG